MSKHETYRRGRHIVFKLHIHLVFVAKYRKGYFTNEILQSMAAHIQRVCDMFEAELTEFNGAADHVHLLFNYPLKLSVSLLVNRLKGVSSHYISMEFKHHISNYLWRGSLWSPSYFVVSCGGAPLEVIKKYTENQERPSDMQKAKRDHPCDQGRGLRSKSF